MWPSGETFQRIRIENVLLRNVGDWSSFDGKNPHAPRNGYLPHPAQPGHLEKELIPGEFRVASHQSLKLTLGGGLERFEDPVGNGLLLCH